MKISAINISNNNQVSHKAVNQKLYQRAKNEFTKYAPYHNQLPLISSIAYRVYYKLLSYEDAIDTLEAIRPYSENALGAITDLINDLKSPPSTQ